ncbi:MAG: helix-turn-helix domain-containing protein [Deltaproteobacteria bacterium]|nr:helix-turn-helix domain-containing protein [Deltaproteobacteria bacterium]
MEIRPIFNEKDHKLALAEIDRLWDSEEGSSDRERFAVLVALVAAYEEKHHPIDPPDPIDAIRFRMEQGGLSRKDLEPMIGSRARVSEVLNGRRELTLPMIRRLSRGLGITADILAGVRLKQGGSERTGRVNPFMASPSVLLDTKYRRGGSAPRTLVEGYACM